MGQASPSVEPPDHAEGGAGLHATGRSAALISAFPWSLTPLGAMSGWDPQFLVALNLMLEAHFPMFLTWGDRQHLFYNDAFETVLAGKGDCIGRSISAVFPVSWSQIQPFFDRAMAGQSSFLEDLPISLVRNSTLIDTCGLASYSPVRAADGSVGGVLGVVYETTRRVTSEIALRTNQDILLTVADAAPALLWRCDPDGWISWANQDFVSYVGASVVGMRWNDNVHPDDIAPAQLAYEESLRTGKSFESRQRLRGKDGQWSCFLVRARQILGDDGTVLAWCGSAADIENMAAPDHNPLSQFAEGHAALMWMGTVATREVHALNTEALPAWGLPESEQGVAWEDWISFADPDDRAQLSALFDRAAAGEVAQASFRGVARSGVTRRFHATGFQIPPGTDAKPRVGGLIVEQKIETGARIYLIDTDAASQNGLFHRLTRQGFRVRAFDTAADFQRVSGDLAPGCVVLVDHGDGASTLRAATMLSGANGLPWLVVGHFEHRLQEVVQMMKLGAADILTDPADDSVGDAAQGALTTTYGRSLDRTGGEARQKLAQLSSRERQVFDGLIAGGTNKTIAKALDISPRTVETHRAHVMDRLDVTTLAELVQLASAAGVTVNRA